ncbi:MAG: MAPEG family protein [Alphaproteobacteria bacterium]|nr:MAPEG family protein [Alphaproteobacteria bacterium]
MYTLTALVTLLAVVFYSVLTIDVGRARGRHGIQAPATTGNPDFERRYRVQMNTLEWMPIFLPSLWLFAATISDPIAAAIGLVWIIGRIIYSISYVSLPSKRHAGFMIQFLAVFALWAGASGALTWKLIH